MFLLRFARASSSNYPEKISNTTTFLLSDLIKNQPCFKTRRIRSYQPSFWRDCAKNWHTNPMPRMNIRFWDSDSDLSVRECELVEKAATRGKNVDVFFEFEGKQPACRGKRAGIFTWYISIADCDISGVIWSAGSVFVAGKLGIGVGVSTDNDKSKFKDHGGNGLRLGFITVTLICYLGWDWYEPVTV